MESKVWWASKTIVVNLVALLASVLAAAGVADLGVEAQGSIVGIVLTVVNIWLRFKTSAPVTVSRE